MRFWTEYLELLWVYDEAAFAEGATRFHSLGGAEAHAARHCSRPHALDFYADDVPALHRHWRQRGFVLPEVVYWRLKKTAPEAPPNFFYQ